MDRWMDMTDDERQDLIELESKAFKMFNDGRSPVELVQEGVCTSEEAEELYKDYLALKEDTEQRELTEESKDKITTQIGLLGSRLARIELKLMNSYLLPKTRECESCGFEGKYGVGVVCKKCGKVNAHIEKDIEKGLLEGIEFESYRPWEEE